MDRVLQMVLFILNGSNAGVGFGQTFLRDDFQFTKSNRAASCSSMNTMQC